MFLLVPMSFSRPGSQTSGAIPWANTLLVIANVIVFWLGGPWNQPVGPGTGPFSVLMYGFSHAGIWHLVGNMWFLLIFGHAANRRLGNAAYLACYLGCIVAIGIFARIFIGAPLIGASGGISAVIVIALLLIPSAVLELGYFVLFPLSLLVGLLSRPKEPVHWFIRWDRFSIGALWCLLLVPLMEIWSLFWTGWNWTNLGHLIGMLCGVVAVLLLPTRISMRRPVGVA